MLTGFSRAGLTMVGGFWRGLEHGHAHSVEIGVFVT